MNTAQLYCQGACAACSTLARSLVDAGVDLEIHDVTSDPVAFDTVTGLGYRSLPVLVAPDGRAAAGPAAHALARSLGAATPRAAHRHVDYLDRDADPEPSATAPGLHPHVASLAALIGKWTGPGHGSYPGIEDFDYLETLRFGHTGKPFLTYAQRSVHAGDDRALHVETGYLRPAGPGRVELVVAQPTGIVEVDEGILDTADDRLEIRLVSRCVGLTSSAKEVTSVERTFDLDGGVLRTTLAMAAVGHRLTHHLASRLQRADTTSEGEQS